MGAVETMMIDCAFTEIGHSLGLPTQAYMGLSDAKALDAQAGLESGLGTVLAALSGVDNVSGPGMLDSSRASASRSWSSNNEICGMAQRLIRGIEPPTTSRAPLFEELLRDKHLLIAKHTRRHLRDEIALPGAVIDRANSRVDRGGRPDARRARAEGSRSAACRMATVAAR